MIKTYKTPCLVIGSGCAGFNGADWLYDLGFSDVLLVTEGINMGTSRNTGSDKQTYYKLALSSDCTDSVGKMAESYFKGQAMSGELALCESANSAACFFKLFGLGVPFPQNDYGEILGYQTDHDDTKRATSAGPLTSKFMTEALEKSVNAKGIKIVDNVVVFKLFEKDGKIKGALGVEKGSGEYVLFETPAILLATGGSAALYRDSVFPPSQTGMSGMAIELGAKTSNLTEWQYGLASIDFRWNVSGSYQQVLPRYVSVDENGVEREFLYESLSSEEVLLYTFRKGYQWPFDSRKKDASSMVDLLVHKEVLLGRKVYMDFMNNPKTYDEKNLPEEAYIYLKNSDAFGEKPIDRLLAMNKRAYQLYLDHGIDLKTKYLRVAVCAQHENGGISVDKNYQSTIDGLYVAGEAAGVFGVYRPGGSALNSTQVSSMRAAQHIKKENRQMPCSILKDAESFIEKISENGKNISFSEEIKNIQAKMSDYAAFLRDEEKIKELKAEIEQKLSEVFSRAVKKENVVAFVKYRDLLLTANEILSALILWCEEIGARGSAMSKNSEKMDSSGVVIYTENGKAYTEMPCEIPESEVWFEKVYNKQ